MIPPTDQDMFFYELGKQYGTPNQYIWNEQQASLPHCFNSGDVVYLHVLGRPMIVLNSVQAAVDLLEKRSSNYSDRPNFPIFEL